MKLKLDDDVFTSFNDLENIGNCPIAKQLKKIFPAANISVFYARVEINRKEYMLFGGQANQLKEMFYKTRPREVEIIGLELPDYTFTVSGPGKECKYTGFNRAKVTSDSGYLAIVHIEDSTELFHVESNKIPDGLIAYLDDTHSGNYTIAGIFKKCS